jgi:hypothetical protein
LEGLCWLFGGEMEDPRRNWMDWIGLPFWRMIRGWILDPKMIESISLSLLLCFAFGVAWKAHSPYPPLPGFLPTRRRGGGDISGHLESRYPSCDTHQQRLMGTSRTHPTPKKNTHQVTHFRCVSLHSCHSHSVCILCNILLDSHNI